ncbi:PAS domain-containing protein [Mucilaginibacter sp. SP1R1]|uniref:PAS domain-containing protein n=1 Tax=Mucilaginibacter sp. SP1R1 TaxID=2723091 RepID=UPI00160788AF|nr:PAS domain-containing protein [Mucilaginibacter sp. SP1R1]MBB6148329.1 PAS domain S-box-containing protein [Mucilaginibacter sp. SP1R1]
MEVNTKTYNETLAAGKLYSSTYQGFKSVFDNNPIPMWLVAKDDLSILYVNQAVVTHYGYAISELQRMIIKDMEVKGDAEDHFVNLQRIVKHIKKCGTIIHVKMISQDMEIENRPVMLVSTIDVTDEFTIRKSLQNAKANLQTILQTSDNGYILFDTGLKVFSFNENAAEFAFNKYNINLERGASLTDCFLLEKLPRLVDSAIKTLGGSSIKYEIDYKQSVEIILWYEIRLAPIRDQNDNIIGIMVSINDITERKNDRKALCSAYNKIEGQIEHMQTIAWKQSHLIRQPLANLKGLLLMLTENPSDEEVLAYIKKEFEKMDTIIIEMANDVVNLI